MKLAVSRNSRLLLLSAAIGATSLTGCKSLSWKPTSLFAWNRQPDAETLELPESPATKYSPSTIASTGVGTPGSGTKSTPSSAYGYTAPGGGLAAKANGYQTGPYQVGGSGSKPGAGATALSTKPGSGLANPYGGSYGKSATVGGSGTSNIQLPTGVQEALSKNKTAPANYPNISLPSGSTSQTPTIPVSTPTSSGYSTPNLPTYPTLPSVGTTTASGSVSTSSRNPSSAYSGATTLGMPNLPTASAGTAVSVPSTKTVVTSPPASTSFAPGTTGRSTKYDFGK